MILGTRAYYAKRKAKIEARMVLRYYYKGIPYSLDPDDLEMIPADLRKSVLWGSADMIDDEGNLRRVHSEKPDRADDIDYMENLAKQRIDAVVSAVVPSGTAIRIEVSPDEDGEKQEIKDETRRKLFRRLLNFGDRFDSGKPEQDFIRWLRLVLRDVAQTGDGAILPQYVPIGAENEFPGRVRFNFYPYEAWDRQNDPINGDAEFFRVEFVYVDNNSKKYWYRRDYYPTFTRIYHDAPMPDNWERGVPPPKHEPAPNDPFAGVAPPEMDIAEESTEDGVLPQLGQICFVDVIWGEREFEEYRGWPEIWYDDLPGIDASNELLNAMPEAVVYVGNQPLFLIDAQPSPGPDGKPKPLSRKDLGAGAVQELASVNNLEGGRQARVTFPENAPAQLMHVEGLKHTRAASMAGTPNLRLDEQGMQEISRMSGFAYQILTSQFNDKVDEIRKTAVAKILKALRLGIKLLKIKGELPEGLPDDFDITLDYGQQKLTEDELAKQATRMLIYDKLGFPRDVIARMIPGVSTDDIERIVEAVKKRQELDEKLLIKGMQQAASSAIKTPDAPEAGGDIDNKAR